MELNYNKEKLNDLLFNFHLLTKANICLFDTSFHAICACGELPKFCSKIRENPALRKQCHLSDALYSKECIKNNESITYTCHAGIVETITPIIFDGVLLGYIIFGGLCDEENIYSNPTLIESVCEKYSLDKDEFLTYYNSLNSCNHKQLKAYIFVLSLCIKNILAEELLKPNDRLFPIKIISYIKAHFTEKISVKEICNTFHITSKTLYRIVKKTTDKTVNEYLTSLRIENAKTLLVKTDLPVAEISFQSGFSDYNYFIKVFKKYTATSPLQYRKNKTK